MRFRRGLRRRFRTDRGRATGDVIGVDFVRRRVLLPGETAAGAGPAAAPQRHLRVVRVPGEGR